MLRNTTRDTEEDCKLVDIMKAECRFQTFKLAELALFYEEGNAFSTFVNLKDAHDTLW